MRSVKFFNVFAVLFISFSLGLYLVWTEWSTPFSSGSLAQSSSTEPEPSIRAEDEQISIPSLGSSLFDKIFSQVSEGSNTRAYKVPYPFTDLLQQLKKSTGGVPPRLTLFAMGRSLQRSAAIEGLPQVLSLDPYYRFPRLVMGFTEESINEESKIRLNLKDRLYIGMNERAKLLEVISYNDEAGRFEYQVVKDYESGRNPQVFYANRQVCLGCHQNQTPIFSEAPWSESNANEEMQKELTRVMTAQIPSAACGTKGNEKFCYEDTNAQRKYFYYGAPLVVPLEEPYAIDKAVASANQYHAFHKMYQRICADASCRKELLRQIFLLKLTAQSRLLQTDKVKAANLSLQDKWQKEFPAGMILPIAAIKNRNPIKDHKDRGKEDLFEAMGQGAVKDHLKELHLNSDVPGEFEPLNPRPMDRYHILKSALADSGDVSRLALGYSEFFTSSDAQMIDRILASRPESNSLSESVSQKCKVKRSSSTSSTEYTIACSLNEKRFGIEFSSFLRNDSGAAVKGSNLRMNFPSMNCDLSAINTEENIWKGIACPALTGLRPLIFTDSQSRSWLFFYLPGGLNLRALDGRRLLPLRLPDISKLKAGEELVFDADVKLNRDAEVLAMALEAALQDESLKNIFAGPALDRLAVMNLTLRALNKRDIGLPDLSSQMTSLPKQLEDKGMVMPEFNGATVGERALKAATQNCLPCHSNSVGVPPAFLGNPELPLSVFDHCTKLATCSGRMLFRLKMWECKESDYAVKKTPMPPLFRIKSLVTDLNHWIAVDRKALFASLTQIFPKDSMTTAVMQAFGDQKVDRTTAENFINDLGQTTCPTMDSDMFERLPRCDQSLRVAAPACDSLSGR